MIVEDEQDTYNGSVDVDYDHVDEEISNVDVCHGALPDYTSINKTLYAYKRSSSTTANLGSIFGHILVTTMLEFNFSCLMSLFCILLLMQVMYFLLI